ncbi:MAG: GNAT family N-acetyltransferase [Actinomycetota bacterium]
MKDLKTRLDIRQNADEQRFEAHLDGEVIGYAEYQEKQKGVRDFTHTFVEEDQRDQGVAAELVRASLERTRQDGMQVWATCPYTKDYLNEHEEFQDLIADKGGHKDDHPEGKDFNVPG